MGGEKEEEEDNEDIDMLWKLSSYASQSTPGHLKRQTHTSHAYESKIAP
jgi:hypothetical protein